MGPFDGVITLLFKKERHANWGARSESSTVESLHLTAKKTGNSLDKTGRLRVQTNKKKPSGALKLFLCRLL